MAKRGTHPFAAGVRWGEIYFRRGEDTAPYHFTLVETDIKAERQLKCGRDGARPSLFAVAIDIKAEWIGLHIGGFGEGGGARIVRGYPNEAKRGRNMRKFLMSP